MPVTPYSAQVSDAELEELKSRVSRARYARSSSRTPWRGGADPDYLRVLMKYWVDDFDWRGGEPELNAYPQFQTKIDGKVLHFVHVRGARPADAPAHIPILLGHGWPSCFVEMLPLVDRLTDPGRFGGDPANAVDVVVSSLPGFLYSELPDQPLTRAAMAKTLHTLMTPRSRLPPLRKRTCQPVQLGHQQRVAGPASRQRFREARADPGWCL